MDSVPLPPVTANVEKQQTEKAESGKPVKCEVCNVWCSGVIAYQSHLQGRQHFANLVDPGSKNKKRPSTTPMEVLMCDLCNVACQGKEQLDAHTAGIRHLKKARHQSNDVIDPKTLSFIKDLGDKRYECTICNVQVTGEVPIASHIEGLKHKKKAHDYNSSDKKNDLEPPNKKNKTSSSEEKLECKICKIPVNSLFQLEEHRSSVKHKHKEESYNKWALQEANIGKDYDAWDPSG